MKLLNPNFPALSCSTFLRIILLFSVTLLCLKPATSSATPTNETDRLALLKFKESIYYDPYGILSSWNDSFHFCNWHGITCGRCHQRVITLELQGHNLRGTIPPFLGPSTFETIASMVKFQRKLVSCSNCENSILQITRWEERFQPTCPTALNLGI
ncbi:hypothetical protein ACB092_11G025600 [Castanea dentata]